MYQFNRDSEEMEDLINSRLTVASSEDYGKGDIEISSVRVGGSKKEPGRVAIRFSKFIVQLVCKLYISTL